MVDGPKGFVNRLRIFFKAINKSYVVSCVKDRKRKNIKMQIETITVKIAKTDKEKLKKLHQKFSNRQTYSYGIIFQFLSIPFENNKFAIFSKMHLF